MFTTKKRSTVYFQLIGMDRSSYTRLVATPSIKRDSDKLFTHPAAKPHTMQNTKYKFLWSTLLITATEIAVIIAKEPTHS